MMKKITAITLFCLLALSSCVKMDTPRPQSFSRTVLLYLASDGNNLQPYAETDLANLVRGYLPVRTNKDEALLIFLDDGKDQPALHRYYASGRNGDAYKELVKRYDSSFNSADPDCLRRVLDDVETYYPSERRGLVLWSHGTGWLPPGYYANPKETKSAGVKSFAEESGTEMDIRDLADVITRHYEFILFDSCLMSTVEVAYQLKDKTDYIIASCAEVLVQGFPYTSIAQDFFYDHTGSGNSALKDICDRYFVYYDALTGLSRTATVSLIDCRHLDELSFVCRKIFSLHKAEMSRVDPSSVQRYYTGDKHWFYDLSDYISKFATESEFDELSSVMDKCVPYKLATPWILGVVQVRTHCGLSTYIPIPDATYLNDYYKTLDWTQDTGAL
ncbi:MAG: hypothetical protein IKX60_07370 [Bacteroidales bacterium]|nr:hypothetical protein [Bacteroidales bacterium]